MQNPSSGGLPSLLSPFHPGGPNIETPPRPVNPVPDPILDNYITESMNTFLEEQEAQLATERDDLERKSSVLQREVEEMTKLQSEKQKSIENMSGMLQREQDTVAKYTEEIAGIKEEIVSAKMYLQNLELKLERIHERRVQEEEQARMRNQEVCKEIEKLTEGLKLIQETVDELAEEKEELSYKLQAKEEIQRQSDMESKVLS